MNVENDRESKKVDTDNDQVNTLVKRLMETEIALQALIDGQVDAVIDPDTNTPIMLRKAQDALRQSNDLLETIFSSIHNSIAYMDCDFNFIRVNRAYAETDGREPEFYPGRNHFDLYPNEENEIIFRKVVETGIPYYAFSKPFTYHEHPERGVTYWDWSLQPIRDADGSVTGVLLNLINVTERIQAENALRESQVMFESLFESAPDANILTDSEGKILAVNHQVEEQFGYQRSELIGKPIEVLIPTRFQKKHEQSRLIYSGDPHTRPMGIGLDLFGLRKNEQEFPVDVNLTPLQTINGTLILAVVRDISLRKQVENELREQTQFVRLLQDIAVASNEANSVESAFQYAVDRICRYTGWSIGHALVLDETNEYLVSTRIWHLDRPGIFRQFRAQTEAISFEGGIGLPGQVLKTGMPSWIKSVVQDPNFTRKKTAQQAGLKGAFGFPVLIGKKVVSVLEFFSTEEEEPDEDLLNIMLHVGAQLGRVIERQQNHERLEKQEALLRTVLDTLPVGVWVTDEYGKIVMGNPEGMRIWNGTNPFYPEQFGETRGWWYQSGQPIIPRDWAISRALSNGEVSIDEIIEIEAEGGTRKVIYNSAFPLRDSNQRIIGAIAVNQDITERKQLEAELAEVQHRLLNSIEKERSRLAQDLHDGPIQDLYGVTYQIQALRGDMPPAEKEALIDRTGDLIQQVISSLRTTMSELKPPSLSHFGVTKAIQSHAEQLQLQHPEMNIHLDLAEDNKKLSEQERLVLFRNYQQLAGNVIRHAQAKNLWVRLMLEPRSTILEVQDDGQGFTKPQRWIELARKGHLGLVGASERAETLSGRLEIHSRPGKGTLIRTIIPRKE